MSEKKWLAVPGWCLRIGNRLVALFASPVQGVAKIMKCEIKGRRKPLNPASQCNREANNHDGRYRHDDP